MTDGDVGRQGRHDRFWIMDKISLRDRHSVSRTAIMIAEGRKSECITGMCHAKPNFLIGIVSIYCSPSKFYELKPHPTKATSVLPVDARTLGGT